MLLSDLHIHSRFSPGCTEDVEKICRKAIQRGLYSIAFTERLDILPGDNPDESGYMGREAERRPYMAIIREKYRDKLDVLYGLELGTPQFNRPYVEDFLRQRDFDVILGAAHHLPDGRDILSLPFETREDVDAALQAYFETMLGVVRMGRTNVIAHLTYPLRALGAFSDSVSLDAYYPALDPILKTAAQRGMALEISTHGLRNWQQSLEPDAQLIRRFRLFGGDLVSIGSDAYTVEEVGAGVEEAIEFASEMGFTYITVFKNGRAEPQRI